MTPRQVLENRVRADLRNITTLTATTRFDTLACLVADTAVSWSDARKLGDCELLRSAEHNLDILAEIWAKRNGI